MNDWEQILDKILPEDRKILQFISLYWELITNAKTTELLYVLGIRTERNLKFNAKLVGEFRKEMVEKGLLEDRKEYGNIGFQISSDELKEHLTREALQEDWFEEVMQTIQSTFSLSDYSSWQRNTTQFRARLLRDYRLGLYAGDQERVVGLSEIIISSEMESESVEILLGVFSNPFQREILAGFDSEFQETILFALIGEALDQSQPIAELCEFAREYKVSEDLPRFFEIEESIFKGDFDRLNQIIDEPETIQEAMAKGTVSVCRGDFEKGVEYFETAIKIWKSILRKRVGFPDEWQMFLYGVALLKTNEPKFYHFSEKFYKFSRKNYYDSAVYRAVRSLEYYLKNNDRQAKIELSGMESGFFSEKFVRCLLAAIVPAFKLPNFADEFLAKNQDLGYRWVELELTNLVIQKETAAGRQSDKTKSRLEALQSELGLKPIGNLIPQTEDWERGLSALTTVVESIEKKTGAKTKANQSRVSWLVNFESCHVQPILQKLGKTGWTKGRNISLKRLYEETVKEAQEQDKEVVRAALSVESNRYWGGGDIYDFSFKPAIAALVGHPNVFLLKNPAINVELSKSEPTLVVKEVEDNLEISFDTKFSKAGNKVVKETETRYRVLQISEQHVAIAETLRNNKLRIPAKGRDAFIRAIKPLSKTIAVQSDLKEHFEHLPSVEPEKRIHALITPSGDGFHLGFFVKPFGSLPPYFKPGKGSESVIAELNEERTRTKRDLSAERDLLTEIEESCPFLAGFESPNYEWNFSEPEFCLTAMSEMETPRKNGKLVIEWTKGQTLKILGSVNLQNFSLNVKGKNDWFEVSGKVKVNEDLVLSMQELTQLLDQETRGFVELSDGQFIAITEKLRLHLQSLSSVLDKKQRLHGLRTGILEDFSDELENFKANKVWKDHTTKLKKLKNFIPELPSTFQAEFRPYQTEGYFWLSRLANWGVGACLADDMGLGKTLQALAVLVERAEKGAALVVAPVSVCRNWVNEARRFSPTLNFQIFGEGDRKSMIKNLGKYDVLVTSYNLLQLEEELFVKKKFSTIVLDEAQAIKNQTTKRSKTVMKLKGDFRLITTGTPIENHLGELWNLFNFINPGLLGNYPFFKEKFALPIEKDKDKNAQKTLQRVIQPFVLRRLKNDVLDDLPEKTEIRLAVEMSKEERAFYESVRRNALEKIEADDGEMKDKRFRIFAELTRLRLACCHPKLVDKNIPLGSSKLDLFSETIEELLDNKHKALVFSQFVKHLKIVEEYLKSKKISYQYLDGSTPQRKRQERIDAFQAGKGEVFLISLKAGGTGLNLTAADYVIHLDPWWNPAVEDQATDRVHRIGQKRPVTVYRLVTENSVEEKILKLHETKRHLADSLLSKTDASSKLSADDLLALIRDA